MKLMNLAVLAASIALSTGALAQALTTEKDKVSYAIGMNMGQSLKQIPDLGKEIDLTVLMKGQVNLFAQIRNLLQALAHIHTNGIRHFVFFGR